LQYRKLNLWF